jgi:hypothetical protein
LNHKYQILVARSEGPLTPEDAREMGEDALDWLFCMDRWPEEGVGVTDEGKGKERAE